MDASSPTSAASSQLQPPPPYESPTFSSSAPASTSASAPPPSYDHGAVYGEWAMADGRISSSRSLLPSLNETETETGTGTEEDGPHQSGRRRTLLLVYIHGFMGSGLSFQSFPAHVHNYLKESLAETHVVHSKIYPRYKTYKSIEIARDNFSIWLQPHESPATDVILLGHSMGGLLAADVVLLPSQNCESGIPFRHRILGTVSLDAPLLGLHPGIVASGLASFFEPSPDPAKAERDAAAAAAADPAAIGSSSSSSFPSVMPSNLPDPFFDPPFFNDVQFENRGWFKNVMHFAAKHSSGNLLSAAVSHVMSHLEFGGCMADYPGLHARYQSLRALEDVDDLSALAHPGLADANAETRTQVRVRFANYYTVCHGKPKQPKSMPASPAAQPEEEGREQSHDHDHDHGHDRLAVKAASAPDILLHGDGESQASEETQAIMAAPLTELEPMPEPESEPDLDETTTPDLQSAAQDTPGPAPDLIPIPDLPEPPPPPPQTPDLDAFLDKAAQKQAKEEARRAQKAYEQAVKAREKALRERAKQEAKQEAKQLKEAERQKRREAEQAKKLKKEEEKEEKRRLAEEARALHEEVEQQLRLYEQQQQEEEQAPKEKEKKKKERKFCALPGKVDGARDPAWVRVYMEDTDEVGAHCGLFQPGPHYEKLIGDVGSRIVSWVQADASRRAILELDLDSGRPVGRPGRPVPPPLPPR